MRAREIKHHFDQIDELEAKENLQSEKTLLSYPRMKVFKLRLNDKVTIGFTMFFVLAVVLHVICWIIPAADVFLIQAKTFALVLGLIEMIIYYAFGRSDLKD